MSQEERTIFESIDTFLQDFNLVLISINSIERQSLVWDENDHCGNAFITKYIILYMVDSNELVSAGPGGLKVESTTLDKLFKNFLQSNKMMDPIVKFYEIGEYVDELKQYDLEAIELSGTKQHFCASDLAEYFHEQIYDAFRRGKFPGIVARTTALNKRLGSHQLRQLVGLYNTGIIPVTNEELYQENCYRINESEDISFREKSYTNFITNLSNIINRMRRQIL